MALVTVCGLPAVGKSAFAARLQQQLGGIEGKRCVVVNEESMGINKQAGYADSSAEKNTRGSLKSAVEHSLNSGTFVILDSMNYIKGYRYELYCIARSQKVPHCVVWVQCDNDTARERNLSREDRYEDSIFEGLLMRFEAPNASNRWDKPVFEAHTGTQSLPTGSDDAAEVKTEEPATTTSSSTLDDVCQAIVQFVTNATPAPVSLATSSNPHVPADTLFMLDKRTQAIVGQIVQAQKNTGPGTVSIQGCSRSLMLTRLVGMPELQRHRKQFVRLHTQHPPSSVEAITDSFMEYLSSHLS